MKRLGVLTLLALVLAGLNGLPASANTFKNCKALQAVSQNGVALSKNWKNKGSGPIFTPKVSASIYLANKKLDLDKDGIVCEKIKPEIPAPIPAAPEAAPSKSSTVLALQIRAAVAASPAPVRQAIYVSEAAQLSYANKAIIEVFEKHIQWLASTGLALRNELVFVIPRTAGWMNDEIARQGCGRYTLPIGGYAIWADCSGRSVVTRPDVDTEGGSIFSLSAQHVMIHEAWHQWQREAVGTQRGNGDYPKWIWEGSAQAVSRYAIWAVGDQLQDPEALLRDWYTLERPDLRASCVGVKIREMVPNTPWPDKANCGYSKGQVAIDLLVEKYGFNALVKIFQVPKQGGMTDFASVFKSVTGAELELFYDEVDIEMTKRGWK
jgi:hypothetical protein